jgi:AraC-like DNA-binding protein
MPFEADPRDIRLRLGEWSALQLRLNWAYEGPVPVNANHYVSRGLPSFSAWLILQGRAEARAGGRVLVARRGDWIIPMFPPRRQHFSANARLISLNFQLAWPSGEPLYPQGVGFVFPSRRFPRLERQARRLLHAVHGRSPRDVAGFVEHPATLAAYLRLQQSLAAWIESFVTALRILGCMPSRLGPVDERLIRAMAVLDGNAGDKTPSRRAAALAGGLSPSQLDRLFVAQFGVTPRVYRNRKKLEAACAALEGSRASVKEIGYRLGFRQATHFTAWFRRHQGQSPRAYRVARIGRMA